MKNKLHLLALVLALGAGSARAQLIYGPGPALVDTFSAMKSDAGFVSSTLLNLGSVNGVPDNDGVLLMFSYAGLTFNAIPNLAVGDLQVGPGFFADVIFLGKDSVDNNTFGSESTLLGAGNMDLFTSYGAGSTATWSITAATATDLIFWHRDASFGNVKYDMTDVLAFTTFTASTAQHTYFIFGIDDRRTQLGDFDDGVFGVRLNNELVGLEAVPEPSTYGLIGAATLLLFVAARRVRQRTAACG